MRSDTYADVYREWEQDPAAWWLNAARNVSWVAAPKIAHDPQRGPHGHWFPDGTLNTAYNCADRHVEAGQGDRIAMIWDSPLAGATRRYTYRELTDAIARFAGALADAGVTKGDRVLIYMPLVPEAVIAMLASARLGAIHSVVFGGFAANEVAKRIDDAQPKVIVSASCGIEPGRIIEYKPILDEAIAISGAAPQACFILQRPIRPATLGLRDRDFSEALAAASLHPPVAVAATDPLYILYTSGTTGKPKGVVRDNGGHAVALLASMAMIYGAKAGDVFWAASDIGWVVGHSYMVYAPLLAGCTTILYEGKPVGTPDPGSFWRVCEQYKVRTLFTAPTAIRAIRQQDPDGALAREYDLSSLDAVFLAGERCDPPTASWLAGAVSRPVIDHWWQTETGWPITSGFRGIESFDQPAGSGGRAVPGWRAAALDEDGFILPDGQTGALSLALPLPPGAGQTLWRNDEGFDRAYLADRPGWYTTGDAGRVDANGDVWVMGRTDDVINVAGHRLSTGAMEEIVAGHPDVAECAVIAVPDALKGDVPLGLFVLRSNVSRAPEAIAAELIARVREQIGPIAVFKRAIAVERLPKTRSGKILRKTLRAIVAGDKVEVPPTIEDAGVLDALALALGQEAP